MTAITRLLPDVAMKIVNMGPGEGYKLMLHHPVSGEVITVATVHDQPMPGEAQTYAQVLSAAFHLLHVMEKVVEYVQPEGWGADDDGESWDTQIWKAAFRALLTASGEPIPAYLQIKTVHETEACP